MQLRILAMAMRCIVKSAAGETTEIVSVRETLASFCIDNHMCPIEDTPPETPRNIVTLSH